MKRFRSVVLVFLPLLAACAHLGVAQERVLSPRELNSDPAHYHDKIVVVRGFVTLMPGAHNFYQSQELRAEFERRWDASDATFAPGDYAVYCLTIANPAALESVRETLNGKSITVQGRFIANYLDGAVDPGACPLSTAVAILPEDLKRRYPSLYID